MAVLGAKDQQWNVLERDGFEAKFEDIKIWFLIQLLLNHSGKLMLVRSNMAVLS